MQVFRADTSATSAGPGTALQRAGQQRRCRGWRDLCHPDGCESRCPEERWTCVTVGTGCGLRYPRGCQRLWCYGQALDSSWHRRYRGCPMSPAPGPKQHHGHSCGRAGAGDGLWAALQVCERRLLMPGAVPGQQDPAGAGADCGSSDCVATSTSSRAVMQVPQQRGPAPRLCFVAVVHCSFCTVLSLQIMWPVMVTSAPAGINVICQTITLHLAILLYGLTATERSVIQHPSEQIRSSS